MSRPWEARLAKVKRSASVPKAGMPFGKLPAGRGRDRLRLARIHQAGSALVDKRVEADAVDDVERVEDVALGLRHLLPFGVAHEGGDVDVAERHFAGEVQRHHDHARDPEEDDVEAR